MDWASAHPWMTLFLGVFTVGAIREMVHPTDWSKFFPPAPAPKGLTGIYNSANHRTYHRGLSAVDLAAWSDRVRCLR